MHYPCPQDTLARWTAQAKDLETLARAYQRTGRTTLADQVRDRARATRRKARRLKASLDQRGVTA